MLEGPCGGAQQRYFYDPEEGKCLQFRYGGCKGNINNFESKKDCQIACKVNITTGYRGIDESVHLGSCTCLSFIDRVRLKASQRNRKSR